MADQVPDFGCWSCQGKRPAAYIWTAQPSGNEIPLCAECCAAWRANAEREADLAPARIRLLRPVVREVTP